MSLKDTIFAMPMPDPIRVDIPEWGIALYVKQLTAYERDQWEKSCLFDDSKNKDNIRATLIIASVVDDKGQKVFDDSDIAKVSALAIVPIQRLYNAATEANRVSIGDIDELKKS